MSKKWIAHDVHVPRSTRVLIGGFAGMIATTIVHPFDVVKVRMQLYNASVSTLHMGSQVIKCEGFKALYAGLSAALLRQATYTTTRLGCYNYLYADFLNKHGRDPNLREVILIGVYSGLAGALVGGPSEVVLVRLMADGLHNACDGSYCKRYRGLIHAFSEVISKEGIRGLWRGGVLTLTRSVFVSTVQIGTYSIVRQSLRERNIEKGLRLHFYTSTIASFFVAVVSLPVDAIKTQFQVRTDKMTQIEIINNLIKYRGISYFWQGFLPYYVRLTFHTYVSYFLLEYMNDICRSCLEREKKT